MVAYAYEDALESFHRLDATALSQERPEVTCTAG